jgi:tetratricopeptide (TPR) repeat protein
MDAAKEAISKGREARKQGQSAAARAHYAEAARIYRDQNELLAYAHTTRHIADIYQEESNPVAATPLYKECLEVYRGNLGTKILDLANAIRPYALLSEGEGNMELARELWEEARQLYNSIRVTPGVAECEAHIGKLDRSSSSSNGYKETLKG